ncbi:MAG: GNAT family N-acetyltransferase [Bacteroidia bacterium]
MSAWLKNIELSNSHLKLELLSQDHSSGLISAVEDGKLWQLWYTSAPEPNRVLEYINQAIEEYDNGKSYPFAIINTATKKIIGTTRYMNADAANKRLEIGCTWFSKTHQQTGANSICKYLMLRYAFEKLNCIAVEFRTHWYNFSSRNAIAKLGAKQDGILRNHQYDKSGNLRDTVVFSIISSEWPAVKQSLLFRLSKKY